MDLSELSAITNPVEFKREILTWIFDAGINDGLAGFNPEQRCAYWLADLRIDLDMGGLDSYLYSHLAGRLHEVRETIEAHQAAGASQTAALLQQALNLFERYREDNSLESWDDVLAFYDPEGDLERIARQLDALVENVSPFLWENRDQLLQQPMID